MKITMYKRKGINIPVMHNAQEFQALQTFIAGAKVDVIVCIGTWYAGLESMFDDTIKAEIYGFDREQASRRGIKNMMSSSVALIEQDVLSEPSKLIARILKNKSVNFLYCDGGNKIKEIQFYSPLLKSGDFLGTHDWGENKYKLFEEMLKGYKELVNVGATRVWCKL